MATVLIIGGGATAVAAFAGTIGYYVRQWTATATKVNTIVGEPPNYYNQDVCAQFIGNFGDFERLVSEEEQRWLTSVRRPTEKLQKEVARIAGTFKLIHKFAADAEDYGRAKRVLGKMIEEAKVKEVAQRVEYFSPGAGRELLEASNIIIPRSVGEEMVAQLQEGLNSAKTCTQHLKAMHPSWLAQKFGSYHIEEERLISWAREMRSAWELLQKGPEDYTTQEALFLAKEELLNSEDWQALTGRFSAMQREVKELLSVIKPKDVSDEWTLVDGGDDLREHEKPQLTYGQILGQLQELCRSMGGIERYVADDPVVSGFFHYRSELIRIYKERLPQQCHAPFETLLQPEHFEHRTSVLSKQNMRASVFEQMQSVKQVSLQSLSQCAKQICDAKWYHTKLKSELPLKHGENDKYFQVIAALTSS